MGRMRRISLIFTSLMMLVSVLIIIADPDTGYLIVTVILSISLLIYGIRKLIYYFTMARHMVGGKYILFSAVIMLDFGLFTLALTDIPKIYVVLYLMFINAVSGVVLILRTLESRKYGAASWKLNFSHGVINIVLAVMSLVFVSNTHMLVYMYCLGLVYSAVMRIIRACRRTAIVYVQ